MADLFENPAGLDGFEFIELSAPERGVIEPGAQCVEATGQVVERIDDHGYTCISERLFCEPCLLRSADDGAQSVLADER